MKQVMLMHSHLLPASSLFRLAVVLVPEAYLLVELLFCQHAKVQFKALPLWRKLGMRSSNSSMCNSKRQSIQQALRGLMAVVLVATGQTPLGGLQGGRPRSPTAVVLVATGRTHPGRTLQERCGMVVASAPPARAGPRLT